MTDDQEIIRRRALSNSLFKGPQPLGGAIPDALLQEVSIIENEFDSAFYSANCPILLFTKEEPIVHFLKRGWIEGRDPCRNFSTAYYLHANEDVRSSGVNPFVHFVGWGRKEGRFPTPPSIIASPSKAENAINNGALVEDKLPSFPKAAIENERFAYERALILNQFELDFYRTQIIDSNQEVDDLVMHYLERGWRDLLNPSRTFSTQYYLESNPDVKDSGINPFVHYVGWGKAEGRRAMSTTLPLVAPSLSLKSTDNVTLAQSDERLAYERALILKEFNAEFYLHQSPVLEGLSIDPIIDYLQRGWREGLDPSPSFSTKHYLNSNPDVSVSGINPFVHYIGWGRTEGRSGHQANNFGNVKVNPDTVHEENAVRDYFDESYYLSTSPDLVGSDVNLLKHYMQFGWRELRDPCPFFSTSYYLTQNPDIRAVNINPFFHYIAHGRREGRKALSYALRIALKKFNPRVTVIVPNFNHSRFLRDRLDSILSQTYTNFEIVVLDDASSDDSVELINEYVANFSSQIKSIVNEKNSGNVFSQWRRGIEAAGGDLLWICESDDFCEPDFLYNCIQPFRDSSVMVSFGRIQFADNFGKKSDGLDGYRENAEPGVWSQTLIRPASEWFRGTFAISNIIPNVGGCLIRNQKIPDSVWTKTLDYKISGDWYLYCMLSNGGQIAFVPGAVAYFRQHGKNTSVSGFLKPHYYTEHERIITALRNQWGTPDDIVMKFYSNVYRQFQYARAESRLGKLTKLFSNDKVLNVEKASTHVLMCFLGFHLGGGELFPIHLANELAESGYIVSAMVMDSESENEKVRALLDCRIAVYDSQLVEEMGIAPFMERVGVDIIHSHSVSVEFFFFQKHRYQPSIPYVVTLHGSYEVTPIPDDMLLRVLRAVSHWLYLSKKNLEHLKGIPVSGDRVSFVANGMPIDEKSFSVTRKDLGILKGELLFTIASRAIREKGWKIAIEAIKRAQERSKVGLHLMMCGSGPDADLLMMEYKDDPKLHFMGFQDHICGAYKISDVAILPTRFPGESYPLSLIQAMQVGCPIISTDIGEIKNMMLDENVSAGIVAHTSDDDVAFTEEVAKAVLKMTDESIRNEFAKQASKIGSKYDMRKVAKNYIEVYKKYLL